MNKTLISQEQFDQRVERATLTLLGKTEDPAPGVNWHCDRSWTVDKVRALMRIALGDLFEVAVPQRDDESGKFLRRSLPTRYQAHAAAVRMDQCVRRVANGESKIGDISMEDLTILIVYARDVS